MDLEFDRHGFYYIGKIIAVSLVVVFTARFAAGQIGVFALSHESDKFGALPVLAEPIEKPVYQKLAGSDAILANGEGILTEKDRLLAAGKEFIFADLGEMRITYYRGTSPSQRFGEASTTTFNILSKGRDGSFFETPSGIYKIGYKEKNHFSSIGKVWMPWSMHIFGNYFIHGWPYYPGGRPVESAYSGGCIRLSLADAGSLYKLAETGISVLIYAEENPLANRIGAPDKLAVNYFKKIAPVKSVKPPKISADAMLAADFETGEVLFEKNSTSTYPIASVTKLMTALVAAESFQARSLRINKTELATYGSSGGLVAGEIFSSDKLLYPMLLASSNDAAAVFAFEGWNFTGMMNQKAKALGMNLTHYEDSSGLDPRNVSNANDLFTLLKYIYNNKKPIFDILALPKYSAASDNQKKQHTWVNINWTQGDTNLVSGKSGYTPEAKETFAGVFKVKLSEGESRLVAIIILRSDDREKDAGKMIKYLEDTFVYGSVLAERYTDENPKIYFNEANVFEALGRGRPTGEALGRE